VLEAGKRYDTDDLPASSWDTRRFVQSLIAQRQAASVKSLVVV